MRVRLVPRKNFEERLLPLLPRRFSESREFLTRALSAGRNSFFCVLEKGGRIRDVVLVRAEVWGGTLLLAPRNFY